MHDDICVPISPNSSIERSCIRNIRLRKTETFTHMKLRKARFLQGDRIIVIHIVDADDLPALIQQALCGMEPDEPGSARYNRFHTGDFFPKYTRRGLHAVLP